MEKLVGGNLTRKLNEKSISSVSASTVSEELPVSFRSDQYKNSDGKSLILDNIRDYYKVMTLVKSFSGDNVDFYVF